MVYVCFKIINRKGKSFYLQQPLRTPAEDWFLSNSAQFMGVDKLLNLTTSLSKIGTDMK